uniref:Uncharacterized protein n=1 Tax=Onchocerca volvulus TaxID=6282 RepID=A0A8R1U329_ONCVO
MFSDGRNEIQNTSEFIQAKSYKSDECLTAKLNSYEQLHDDSVLSIISATDIHELSENSNIDSTTDSSTKLLSFPTIQSANKEFDSKPTYSSIEELDITQNDDYDIFTNKLMIRLINNLRAKHLNENENERIVIVDDARVILMRRGETVSEVFPNWTIKAFNDLNLYVPYDLNMPVTLRKRERHNDFLIDPPLTNTSAHFAAELGFSMTQNLPTVIYSAPELAALQTARQFIDGAEIGISWLIEPGLARYFSPDESKPTFTIRLQQETIYTIEVINDIIGKETTDEFENRIAKVVSKLKFPRKASTVLIAEDCVINAIIQKFIRNGSKLTTKQHLTINKRIPRLSLMHFDIDSNGKWKPSCASLPGLQGITQTIFNQPDVNFLIRPTIDF